MRKKDKQDREIQLEREKHGVLKKRIEETKMKGKRKGIKI